MNITIQNLVAAAWNLASDNGENPEYDRALVELIAQFLPGDTDHIRPYLQPLILKGHLSEDGPQAMWAVYDQDGECVGVDVVAGNEADALAQFVYAENGWYAVIQDAATYRSDMESR